MARVHVDSWRSTYAGLIPDAYLKSLSHDESEARWRARMNDSPDNVYHVAESSSGEVVGFACGGSNRGDGHFGFEGELYALYLLAEHQRRGCGSLLMRAVAEALQRAGYGSMLTWVLADNPSRRFYEAVGGRPLGSREVEIGGARLEEVAYGWDDLRSLVSLPA